jgi:hypothetical protein
MRIQRPRASQGSQPSPVSRDRRGYDWTDRYPAIATAAAKLRASSFTLDGEAVVVRESSAAPVCVEP